jgi:SAM-dependent methyltransferase
MSDLHEQFGEIDIYVFDQLLRQRLHPAMRVLDVGCGSGRNLVYLLQSGCEVFGIDPDPISIQVVQRLASRLAPRLPPGNFRVESIEQTSFPEAFADAVLCSAVLHFARDDAQFMAMLHGLWRVLRPGGVFFCRLASSIGMEQQVKQIQGRRHRLPDGTERYLVDEALLTSLTRELGGELLDPLKTTVVQNQRCMTTWVVRKAA